MLQNKGAGGERRVQTIQAVLDGVRVEVRLSKHALQRMAERRVSPEELLQAIRSPCEHAYDKSKDVALLLGCNGVALAYTQRGAQLVIVTVMREAEYHHLVGRIGRRRYKEVGGPA